MLKENVHQLLFGFVCRQSNYSIVNWTMPAIPIFNKAFPRFIEPFFNSFAGPTSFVFFNLLYLTLFLAELFFFLLFLPFLIQSTWLAISLSALFLTIFSYFVLQFYFAAKKTEQLIQLKDQFIASCRQLAGSPKEGITHHLSIAAALSKLASYLEEFEWQFYRIPRYLQSLNRPLSSFSAFCHWQDVFRFKQLLLYAAIEEHMNQIRSTADRSRNACLIGQYLSGSFEAFYRAQTISQPQRFSQK